MNTDTMEEHKDDLPLMVAEPEMAAPDTDPAAREAALTAREEALAVKERRFMAREHLLAMGLPEEILQHVDCGSETGMEQALKIAALAAQAAARVPALPVPPTSQPPAPAFASYVDRARLFQEDPEAYRLMRSQ